MNYRIIPVTPYQQNCSLVWCEQTRKGVLIDPGGDESRLLAAIAQHEVVLEKILLTHGHLDHVGATKVIAETLSVPVFGPQCEDEFLLRSLPQQAVMFGFPPAEPFSPDQWLNDGDAISVGEMRFEVIHCPGHTPGHVVFYQHEAQRVFVGDVLFQGSIGRTDFPRGNYEQLIASITERLLPLGDDVVFVPGHGPTSTLGHERQFNPFLQRKSSAG